MDLVEQLLLEKSRRELIQKSVSADKTKAYGTTRWDRRRYVSIFPTAANYNRLDMNALFKANLLDFLVPVHGDREIGKGKDYSVELLFEGICDKLKDELKRNNYKIEFKVIYRAIINAINASDVLVSCTCPDWKYRQAYAATTGQYNAGRPELRPANITNPNDTKGAGCKHVMNVLGNLDWAMKLATCINNYILFMKDNYENLFAEIIWPAISGMTYDEAYQQGLFGELASTVGELNSEGTAYSDVDTTEIDATNNYAKNKYFKRRPPEEPEEEVPGQQQLDLTDDAVPNIAKGSLERYYVDENHTRDETAARFNITPWQLTELLNKYDIRKRG